MNEELDKRVLACAQRCGINPADKAVVGRLKELIAISVAPHGGTGRDKTRRSAARPGATRRG